MPNIETSEILGLLSIVKSQLEGQELETLEDRLYNFDLKDGKLLKVLAFKGFNNKVTLEVSVANFDNA